MNASREVEDKKKDEFLQLLTPNTQRVPNVTKAEGTISPTFRDVWPQIISSFIAVSGYVQIGICIGYSGILLVQLSQDSNLVGFNKAVASWIASLFAVAHLIAVMFLPLLDLIGRKKMVLLSTLPFFINWMLIYSTTSSVWPIYVARTLAGVGGGLVCGTIPVYVSEISHVNYRSMMLSLTSFLVSLGMLLSAVVGTFLEWHSACLVFAMMSALSLVWSFFIPESPYWLASFSSCKEDSMEKPVRYLNRPEKLYHESWAQMIRLRQEKESLELNKNMSSTCFETLSKVTENLKQRRSLIPLMLMTILIVLQQASGIYCVIYYSVNLFDSLGSDLGYGISPYSANIAMNVIRLLVSFVATGFSKTIGRKPMILCSSLIMCVSSAIVAVFMHLNGITTVLFEKNRLVGELSSNGNAIYNYVIILGILAYIGGGGVGVMVLPWVLTSELLPTETRATGNALAMVLGNFSMFVAAKTFPGLLDLATLPTIFALYSVVSLLIAIFFHRFFPETFGKTFDEISGYFDRRTTPRNDHVESH